MTREWSAAVLCGGGSRRMGTDKALVEIDGAPMLRRVAVAVRRAGAGHVAVVGSGSPDDDARRRGALAGLDIEAVADDHPGEGPLGGLLTALRTARHDVVLVVACDLVAPSAAALQATVAALAHHDVAVPTGERAQWLHAAWHRRVAEPLRKQFDAGERSVGGAVEAAGLTVAWVDDLDTAALADADTPEDLPRQVPRKG
ncbi:MAG TPA: molybdenum cofactor guanylyltransferase [Acidimicrobiales bacterium]|nr:molybdenum cofactor guanylyltransferase [Acidimicrobiales bacterium]